MTDNDEVTLNEITARELPGAKWVALTETQGRERYHLLAITDDSVDYDDVFGGDPISFFVHQGDLSFAGPLVLKNDGSCAVYVIEGSLAVDGPLVITDGGTTSPLWVRGNLSAGTLGVLMNTHLFVEGDVTVAGELAVFLRDSGHLVINGELATGTSIAASFDGALYLPEDAVEPISGDELEARWSDEVKEIPNRPLAIAMVLSQGRRLLRA